MAVFILSTETDPPADRIEWGLKEAGVDVVRWRGLGSLGAHTASISLDGLDCVHLDDRKIKPQDTVWLRTGAQGPEFAGFQRSVLLAIERTGAFCINKWSAASMAQDQPFQLSLAKQCGLRVPAAVLSNSPRFVREFLAKVGTDSATVSSNTLQCNAAVYRQKIEGLNVRVTMLNRDFHGHAITQPPPPQGWNVNGANGTERVDRIPLPAETEAKLRRFADHANLAFACFDMVLDPKGEWWFAEMNPSGEFLWIDDRHPDTGLFVSMLELLSAREACPNARFPSYRQCLSVCPPPAAQASAMGGLPALAAAVDFEQS